MRTGVAPAVVAPVADRQEVDEPLAMVATADRSTTGRSDALAPPGSLRRGRAVKTITGRSEQFSHSRSVAVRTGEADHAGTVS